MGQLAFHSPLGELTLSSVRENGAEKLVSVDWGRGALEEPDRFLEALRQRLELYFDGDRQDFSDVPCLLPGTACQRKVWEAVRKIPFGQTMTYGRIAKLLGTCPRAVGRAVGLNPLPVVIPCHRVVGKGSLGGYTSPEGLEDKKFLLHLESGPENGAA